MPVTFNTPIAVSPTQHKAIMHAHGWACAHRQDEKGQHYIKVWTHDKETIEQITQIINTVK